MCEVKQRDLTIDIIKALGIICMVGGHCGFPFTHFIGLFHMAIFFIASGYCYKDKNSADLKGVTRFFKRKITTLWLPYVLWTAIYSLLHNFFICINVYTDNALLSNYVSGRVIEVTERWSAADMTKNILKAMLLHGGTQIGGAFWFLAALMELSVSYCIIDFLLNILLKENSTKKFVIQWIISIIFLCIGFFCYQLGYSLSGVDKVLSSYILFHGGITAKKYGWSSKERSYTRHLVILVISFVTLMVCNQFGSISLGENSYVNPVYFLIVSTMGWQFLYEIAFFIGKISQLKKVFVCIGQNTLAIVIFHFLCFKIVSYIGVFVNHQPLFLVAAFPVLYREGFWWVAYMFVGIFIPICLEVLWKKSKNIFKN